MMKNPLQDSLQPTRRIRLIADHLRAVGPYQHGQDYEVLAVDAARLVPDRGFCYVDDQAMAASSPASTDREDLL